MNFDLKPILRILSAKLSFPYHRPVSNLGTRLKESVIGGAACLDHGAVVRHPRGHLTSAQATAHK